MSANQFAQKMANARAKLFEQITRFDKRVPETFARQAHFSIRID
jgi:hypothetical protein